MVFAFLYALSRKLWVTVLSGGFLFLGFGIANYFVVESRGQPILPWDIQGVGTAMTVFPGVRLPAHPGDDIGCHGLPACSGGQREADYRGKAL